MHATAAASLRAARGRCIMEGRLASCRSPSAPARPGSLAFPSSHPLALPILVMAGFLTDDSRDLMSVAGLVLAVIQTVALIAASPRWRRIVLTFVGVAGVHAAVWTIGSPLLFLALWYMRSRGGAPLTPDQDIPGVTMLLALAWAFLPGFVLDWFPKRWTANEVFETPSTTIFFVLVLIFAVRLPVWQSVELSPRQSVELSAALWLAMYAGLFALLCLVAQAIALKERFALGRSS